MKYRLIACDMDETFLNDNSEIPEVNKKMVKLLDEEYGVKFVPSSGRGQHSLKNEIKWLGFDKLDNEYIIGLNGATITDAKTGKILYFNGLDFDTTNELFQVGVEKNICIEIYTGDNLYAYNMNKSEADNMELKGIDWTEIKEPSMDFLKEERIAKIIFQSHDMDYLINIQEKINPSIKEKVEYTYSSGRYLEFNALNINKGEGLKELCKILNIPIEATIAVGDNHNDMSMLKVAGLSVAVSNAVEEIKNAVDYVGTYSNNDGILEEIFEKFIKEK